jgi:hypothetical protein
MCVCACGPYPVARWRRVRGPGWGDVTDGDPPRGPRALAPSPSPSVCCCFWGIVSVRWWSTMAVDGRTGAMIGLGPDSGAKATAEWSRVDGPALCRVCRRVRRCRACPREAMLDAAAGVERRRNGQERYWLDGGREWESKTQVARRADSPAENTGKKNAGSRKQSRSSYGSAASAAAVVALRTCLRLRGAGDAPQHAVLQPCSFFLGTPTRHLQPACMPS